MITIRTSKVHETRMTNNHDGTTTFEMRQDKQTTHYFEGLLQHLVDQNVITVHERDGKRVFSGNFGFEIEVL